MSKVIHLRAYTSPSNAPTLVLMDLQQEHLATPGAFGAGLDMALANCGAALKRARAGGLPVAFARMLPRPDATEAVATSARWIDGFMPTRADMIFDRDRPSCYASSEFSDVIGLGSRHFVLAGFTGETSCLATAIDAYHRGHRVTFLSDASASRPLGRLGTDQAHEAVTALIARYASVRSTAEWVAECARAALVTRRR
jgi:nicotinamidase-related amidase